MTMVYRCDPDARGIVAELGFVLADLGHAPPPESTGTILVLPAAEVASVAYAG